MIFSPVRTSIFIAALSIIGGAAAYAASPEPVDLGRLADRAGDQPISAAGLGTLNVANLAHRIKQLASPALLAGSFQST